MRRFRVGLGQINPTVGDFEGNVQKIVEAIERARALGCQLVAFPELAVPGYPPEDLLFKPAFIEANRKAPHVDTRHSLGLTVDLLPIDLDEGRSEEHTSELQSLAYLVCRLLLEKKKHMSNTE